MKRNPIITPLFLCRELKKHQRNSRSNLSATMSDVPLHLMQELNFLIKFCIFNSPGKVF